MHYIKFYRNRTKLVSYQHKLVVWVSPYDPKKMFTLNVFLLHSKTELKAENTSLKYNIVHYLNFQST